MSGDVSSLSVISVPVSLILFSFTAIYLSFGRIAFDVFRVYS